MNTPGNQKVSVVMPAYNASRTLAAAIDSVLGQTYRNLELVIADDASTDDTCGIVRSYDDPRLKLLLAPQNGGEGAARDLAIAHATGDCLTVIDADDAWDERRLEKLTALIPTSGEEWMVVDNIMQCYERGGELEHWRPLWPEGAVPQTFVEFLANPSHLIKPLFPRGVIDRLRLQHSDCPFGADAQFFIRAIKGASLEWRVCPEALYFYRLTPGSMSSLPQKHVIKRDVIRGLTDELEFSPGERGALQQHLDILERHIRYEPLLSALRQGSYGRAFAVVLGSPGLLLQLFARLPASLRYRFHLWRRGGTSR